MKNIVSIQELVTFMRDAAYADDLEHGIDWSARIIHPSTDDGVVGYSCGMWHRYPQDERVNISFSYDEKRGICNFDKWQGEIKIDCDRTPTFEEFKQTVIELFKIKKLYKSKQ